MTVNAEFGKTKNEISRKKQSGYYKNIERLCDQYRREKIQVGSSIKGAAFSGGNARFRQHLQINYHLVERIGAEPVLPPRTLLYKPENQNDEADQWDKRDQEPPTRFIQVVQASNTNSN